MGQKTGSIKLLISIIIALLIVGGSWFLTSKSPPDRNTMKYVTSSESLVTESIDDDSSNSDNKTTTALQTTANNKTTVAGKTTTNKATTVVTTTKAPSTTQTKSLPVLNHYNLSSAQKTVFYDLYNAISNGTSNIPINASISSEDLKEVYYIAKNLNYYSVNAPLSFTYKYYSQSGVITSVSLEFPFSKEEGNRKTSALKNKVNAIKAGIPKGSDFDKIKYIHDYIINNCRYNTNAVNNTEAYPSAFTAYGALVEGSAVCEGYSKAFSLLCSEVGIDALLVTGKGNGQPHMWNMVKSNGQWYQMDVTWDDATVGGQDALHYSYFNITTQQISQDHVIEDSFLVIPNATATADNYFVYNNLLANSYEEAKSIVAAEAKKALSTGRVIRFKAANQSVYNEIYSNMLCNNGDIFDILTRSVGSENIGSVSSSSKGSTTGYEISISF